METRRACFDLSGIAVSWVWEKAVELERVSQVEGLTERAYSAVEGMDW